MSQFLVMRSVDGRLRSILVFDDGDENALRAYERAEWKGIECVLLGATWLGEAMATHRAWFDDPRLGFEFSELVGGEDSR